MIDAAPPVPTAHSTRGTITGDGRNTAIARILVIEDHQDTREFFGVVLRNVGHDVRLARDGEEGVAICRQWPPDIVVIDVTMSDDYAAELVREIRQDCHGTGVLAVSSGGPIGSDKRSADVLAEAEQLGADLVLRKPADPEILLQSIAALLGEPPLGAA